jgi:transcriptional regulator with XRE-family HTH domain
MRIRRTGLAARRAAVGYSQEALADKLGLDRTTIVRWERGQNRPQPWTRPRLAVALGVSMDQLGRLLDDPLSPQATASPSGTAVISNPAAAIAVQLPALRQVLDACDIPDDGPTRPVGHLRDAVKAVVGHRLESHYSLLARDLPALLSELLRAQLSCPAGERGELAGLVFQTYRAADAVAGKYGHYDLSARIIELMRRLAHDIDDELLSAVVAYVRTEVFFANGRLDTARRLLERAAGALAPGRSATAAALYGALHMRAAVTAARACQATLAREHLAEAEQVAQHVHEGVYLGTAFGPSSVRIHRVSLGVELGDVGAALAAARNWVPLPSIPAERRSHFYIDVARAQVHAGAHDNARAALFSAQTVAPEHTTSHPRVQEMLAHLVP